MALLTVVSTGVMLSSCMMSYPGDCVLSRGTEGFSNRHAYKKIRGADRPEGITWAATQTC